MSDDFFGMLGEAVSGFFGNMFKGAGNTAKTGRLKNQISRQKSKIQRLYAEIGRTIYEQYSADEIEVEEELLPFLEKIDKGNELINGYKLELAHIKGMELCPNCGAFIKKDDSFCPKCGFETDGPESASDDDELESSGTEHVTDNEDYEERVIKHTAVDGSSPYTGKYNTDDVNELHITKRTADDVSGLCDSSDLRDPGRGADDEEYDIFDRFQAKAEHHLNDTKREIKGSKDVPKNADSAIYTSYEEEFDIPEINIDEKD